MICTDRQILSICTELFNFLKSDKSEDELHKKVVRKITKQRVIQTEITTGFLTLRMVYKPYAVDGTGLSSGSDEGASVFIYPPFAEDASKTAQRMEIKAYYSERGSEVRLVADVEAQFKSNPFGTRRVITSIEVNTTDPLAT